MPPVWVEPGAAPAKRAYRLGFRDRELSLIVLRQRSLVEHFDAAVPHGAFRLFQPRRDCPVTPRPVVSKEREDFISEHCSRTPLNQLAVAHGRNKIRTCSVIAIFV